MADTDQLTDNHVTILRLLKGTFYGLIFAAYVAFIFVVFVYSTWINALLVAALIALAQFLRFIASDVDRIGWMISSESDQSSDEQATRKSRIQLLVVLIILLHSANIGLLYLSYVLLGQMWALGWLLAVVAIEVMFVKVRSVNRRIRFQYASYGFRDSPILFDSPESVRRRNHAAAVRMEERLDKLHQMAESGEISWKAYKKARDNVRVERVLKE